MGPWWWGLGGGAGPTSEERALFSAAGDTWLDPSLCLPPPPPEPGPPDSCCALALCHLCGHRHLLLPVSPCKNLEVVVGLLPVPQSPQAPPRSVTAPPAWFQPLSAGLISSVGPQESSDSLLSDVGPHPPCWTLRIGFWVLC